MESAAVDRAVTLTIQAQAALLDPSIAPEIRVRIDNAAARARRDAQAIIDAGRREQPSPTLQQILAAA